MGVEPNITVDTFPTQGRHLGVRVLVAFHYDLSRSLGGLVVRDDNESPWQTIIQLDDGRYVLATECQWHPTTKEDRPIDLEARLARRLRPGHPEYDPFYDATDEELAAMVPPRPDAGHSAVGGAEGPPREGP